MAQREIGVKFTVDTTDLAKAEKQWEQVSATASDSVDDFNQVNKAAAETARIIAELTKKEKELVAARSGATNPEEIKKYNRELTKVQTELQNLNTATKKAGDSTKVLAKEFGSAGGLLSGFGTEIGNVIKGFTAFEIGRRVVTGFVGAITDSIGVFTKFDSSLQNLSALTGAVGEDLAFLREEALRLGTTTTRTGTEVLDAFTLIGSQRPELLANKEALAAVTEQAILLSEAAKIDLTEAAGAVTQALGAFKLPAEEAGRVVNVLAAASKEGSVGVGVLAETLRGAGAVARLTGLSVEEFVAASEAIGTELKGAEAATALRAAFIKLQQGAADTNPAIVGLGTAIENLANQGKSAPELFTQFGETAAPAIIALIGQREEFNKLNTAITGTSVAQEQADKNNAAFESGLKRLNASYEALQVTLIDKIKPALTAVVEAGISFLKIITDLPSLIERFSVAIVGLTVAFVGLRIQGIIAAVTSLVTFVAGINFAVAATNIFKLAVFALNVVLRANPIGLIVTAVGILITAFTVLAENFDKVKAVGAAAFAALKEIIFTFVKASFVPLNLLTETLIGIFTLDIDRIKKGFADAAEVFTGAAGRIGKATGDAYSKSLEESAKDLPPPDIEQAKKNGEELAAVDAETAKKIADQREKASKEELARQKKLADDRKKLAEDLAAFILDKENELALLRATNEEQRSRISVEQERETQLAKLTQIEAALVKAGGLTLEKEAELADARVLVEETTQLRLAAVAAKAREDALATELAAIEAGGKERELAIEKSFTETTAEAQKDLQLELLESQALTLEQQLALYKKYGKDTTAIELELLRLRKDIHEQQVNLTEEEVKALEGAFAEANVIRKETLAAGLIDKRQFDKLQLQEEIDFIRAKLAIVKNGGDEELALREELAERVQDQAEIENEERERVQQAIQDTVFNVISDGAQAIGDLITASADRNIAEVERERDASIAALEDQRAKGLISETRYQDLRKNLEIQSNKRILEEKRKAAAAEKAIQITQAIITTAQAVLSAYAAAQLLPIPAGPIIGAINAAAAAAFGAIQIGLIASTPLPKFRKGKVGIDGPGTGQSDSILARISRGESVINADATAQYKGLLEKINSGAKPDEVFNYINRGKFGEKAGSTGVDMRQVESLLSSVNGNIKKNRGVSINLDRRGFAAYIEDERSRVRVINEQFQST